jgi:RNA polymerase sigma-70 factor (ECF subfamily)
MGCLGSGVGETSPNDFDAVLRDVIGAVRRSFPTFHVPPAAFLAYLRERLPADEPPPIALLRMHTSDLYLACACAHSHPAAIAAFEAHCLAPLDRALGKIGIGADAVAEVKQEIRYRVLVGEGRRAEIVDFSGRGDLRGWVRVMAMRQALRRRRRARRELPMEDNELWQRLVRADEPELEQRKVFYRHEFKRAFETALRTLPHREQTILRQHYLDGATLEELAVLYRVHRATVARLLGRARDFVLAATRHHLMSQLDVRPQDVDSILRMIWSRVEISEHALPRGHGR